MGDSCVEGGGRSSKGLKTQYEDAGFVVASAHYRSGRTFVGDLCTKAQHLLLVGGYGICSCGPRLAASVNMPNIWVLHKMVPLFLCSSYWPTDIHVKKRPG